MSNELLLRAALSCSATNSQSEWQKRRLAPTYQPFLYLIDGGSNCREIRAEGISANASFTFSLLKSAISCPLAKKPIAENGSCGLGQRQPQAPSWLWAPGWVCREKAPVWVMEEPCGA